ncbi:HDOD domain-containing protein [Massilia niabensis]|uniref:HDOD domain-containing protein n=1 Tax=Massilia niabensis TaxID=544910 RepID=A0ABW0L0J5_9BURK
MGTLFGNADLLAAIAPLDCVLRLDAPSILTPNLLSLLPPNRVVLAFDAAALAHDGAQKQIAALHERGYRLMLDGALPPSVLRPSAAPAVALDCRDGAPPPSSLLPSFGPHLARRVDSAGRFAECARAGFDWFSGAYPFDAAGGQGQDGTSRRRLLGLLALLARDADSRELELVLKQDPVLSFHLLRLVNSAAFALNTPITGYVQAIAVLGRRQLQRWLQLLLYAGGSADGLPNLLLPLAALRAGQLEMLCKAEGGERDEQDLAFMTGAFSLLDRLLGMPMQDIVGDLRLPGHVEAALLERSGALGERLRMAEHGADSDALRAAGIDGATWWASLLHAHHWAIQVSRNV